MLIEHQGQKPRVHESAWVAPNAVLSGAVTIGPDSRILHGAVLTAEAGARLSVGTECVIMEHAVLRAAGRFNLDVGDQVLVGPHAYLSGCDIKSQSFIATGAMVFNGAIVGEASVVALGGKVHIGTEVPPETLIPMGWLAFGTPARTYRPEEAPEVHEQMNKNLNFMGYVFGIAPDGKTRAEVMLEAMGKYVRALEGHRADLIVED